MISCVPETVETLRKPILSYVLIILSWIELEKVNLVRSEILLLLVKSVSSKTKLEKSHF